MFDNYSEEFINERFDVTSKYWKYYMILITYRSTHPISNNMYTEQHHYIPRCCDGNINDVVELTFREHFIAHRLLSKCSKNNYKKSLLYAIRFMQCSGNNPNRPKLNSRQYNSIKHTLKNIYKQFGHPRGMLGKTHTPEYKQRISDRMTGENHFNYNKKLKNSTKLKISESVAKYYEENGTKPETCKKISEALKNFYKNNINPNLGKKRTKPYKEYTEQSKQNMSTSAKKRASILYTCPHCSKQTNDLNAKRWHFDKCKMKK